MNQVLTENIWKKISSATKTNKYKSYVAVAYFGKEGSEMLPLKSGSLLVVDASEVAVKTGQTCPEELLKLYKQGVKIFSKDFLHAKVFVLGTKVFIGSTNVSNRSANRLVEIAFTSNNRVTIEEAKSFIKSLCKYELGPEELKRLQKLYRPPIIPGNHLRNKKSANPNNKRRFSETSSNKIYLAKLALLEYTDGHETALESGRKEAKLKLQKSARHFLDEFEWKGKIPFCKGDLLVQIVEENGKQLMSAPGRVLHIKRWRNNTRAFVFLEQPNKRRRNVKSIDNKLSVKLNRGGYKDQNAINKILDLWQ